MAFVLLMLGRSGMLHTSMSNLKRRIIVNPLQLLLCAGVTYDIQLITKSAGNVVIDNTVSKLFRNQPQSRLHQTWAK